MISTKEEVADLFSIWNKALQTEKPEEVVACYAEDAILLPTLSKTVRHNHDEIRNYFVDFLSKKPIGKTVEENIRIYGEIAINSGIYTFSLTENNKTTKATARFTFVYKKHQSSWKIIEHHSSLLP